MGDFLKDIRNNFIFIATKSLDKKIDGREITEKLDEQLDKQLGNKSEKIQRGPLTNFLLEMVEGLWGEDLFALVTRVKSWLNDLAYRAKRQEGGTYEKDTEKT